MEVNLKKIKKDQLKISSRPSREIKPENKKIISGIYSVADVLTHAVALVDAIESAIEDCQEEENYD